MQRDILNKLNLDFKRDNETQDQYINRKIDEIVYASTQYCIDSNMKGYVVGISGGLDSFVVGALLAKTGLHIKLVKIPNGIQNDINDSILAIKSISEISNNISSHEFNIGNVCNEFYDQLDNLNLDNPYVTGNIQARMRMVVQYAMANNMLVAGCDHATENIIGYFTKYGDGASDFNPIDGLLKDDLYHMAKVLGCPQSILDKKPAAGLGISQTDEEELGLNYIDDICPYLRGYSIKEEKSKKIEKMFKISEHKRCLPASPITIQKIEKPEFTHVVIDMVYSFIDETLACNNAVNAGIEIINHINMNPDQKVLYVQEAHPKNHCSFINNGGIWPIHGVEGTRGSMLMKEFYTDIIKTINTPLDHYNVFKKGCNSEKEEYSGYLANNKNCGKLFENCSNNVIISGVATEYCVKETVKDFVTAGFNVYLNINGLAYVNYEQHLKTLEEFRLMNVKFI